MHNLADKLFTSGATPHPAPPRPPKKNTHADREKNSGPSLAELTQSLSWPFRMGSSAACGKGWYGGSAAGMPKSKGAHPFPRGLDIELKLYELEQTKLTLWLICPEEERAGYYYGRDSTWCYLQW